MPFFAPRSDRFKTEHARLYALYAIAYTAADVLAAALFIAGSALFLADASALVARWMFLSGSLLFGAKPAIHLLRELHLFRLGQYQKLDT